jgi:hypothetical protein
VDKTDVVSAQITCLRITLLKKASEELKIICAQKVLKYISLSLRTFQKGVQDFNNPV